MQARWLQIGVRPQRIRTYLVLFALAITIPLLGLAVFALNRMADVEATQIERWAVQAARDLASDIDRELDRAFVTLETLKQLKTTEITTESGLLDTRAQPAHPMTL